MIAAIRPLVDRERALQNVALLGVIAKRVVRVPEVRQREGDVGVVAALRQLLDRERTLQHVSFLRVVA